MMSGGGRQLEIPMNWRDIKRRESVFELPAIHEVDSRIFNARYHSAGGPLGVSIEGNGMEIFSNLQRCEASAWRIWAE